jgi:hypothetical protein
MFFIVVISLQAIFMIGHKQPSSLSRQLKEFMPENSQSFTNTSMFKITPLGH